MLSKNQIRFIRSLDQKKKRAENGVFVCEGVRCVKEILRSSLDVISIYGTEEWINEHGKSVGRNTDLYPVNEGELKKISFVKTPHEVLAVVKIPLWKFVPSHLDADWIMGLENIQDPGNLGTLVRLADWFNIRHIVCSKDTADVYNPKVIQATMGSITRVQVHYLDLERLIMDHPRVPVVATTLTGTPIMKADLPRHGLILFGNEAEGISASLLSRVTSQVLIPSSSPHPAVDSINVSAAAAIVLYELRRR
jgi:TrmH family RNA methyltransferase